jgi:hypothetical protein
MQAGGPAHPRSDILQGIIGCLCGIKIGRVVWKSIACEVPTVVLFFFSIGFYMAA